MVYLDGIIASWHVARFNRRKPLRRLKFISARWVSMSLGLANAAGAIDEIEYNCVIVISTATRLHFHSTARSFKL